jgi:hypothetical protein
MNFQELVQRMTALERPVVEEPNEGNLFTGNLEKARAAGQDEADLDGDGDMEKVRENDVEECGMPGMSNMPNGMMGNRQPDSVTMNISMNGNGAGGIRDLMSVLRDLENGGDDRGPEDDGGLDPSVIVKKMSSEPIIGQEDYSNQPDEIYSGIDAVTGTGTDMHSNNGDHRQRQAGLPIAKPQMESLVQRLSQHYQEVKFR